MVKTFASPKVFKANLKRLEWKFDW